MEYRFGNSKKVHSIGETNELTCPNCSKRVKFSVFSNFELRLAADFPFFDSGNVYVLVCPKCAGIFTVESEKGKLFKKGEKLAIGDFDLKEPKKFEA